MPTSSFRLTLRVLLRARCVRNFLTLPSAVTDAMVVRVVAVYSHTTGWAGCAAYQPPAARQSRNPGFVALSHRRLISLFHADGFSSTQLSEMGPARVAQLQDLKIPLEKYAVAATTTALEWSIRSQKRPRESTVPTRTPDFCPPRTFHAFHRSTLCAGGGEGEGNAICPRTLSGERRILHPSRSARAASPAHPYQQESDVPYTATISWRPIGSGHGHRQSRRTTCIPYAHHSEPSAGLVHRGPALPRSPSSIDVLKDTQPLAASRMKRRYCTAKRRRCQRGSTAVNQPSATVRLALSFLIPTRRLADRGAAASRRIVVIVIVTVITYGDDEGIMDGHHMGLGIVHDGRDGHCATRTVSPMAGDCSSDRYFCRPPSTRAANTVGTRPRICQNAGLDVSNIRSDRLTTRMRDAHLLVDPVDPVNSPHATLGRTATAIHRGRRGELEADDLRDSNQQLATHAGRREASHTNHVPERVDDVILRNTDPGDPILSAAVLRKAHTTISASPSKVKPMRNLNPNLGART
ncbi:hypothetical protein GY45DRAFT_1359868, partial [Cubamyces sp. BRFM 1775]